MTDRNSLSFWRPVFLLTGVLTALSGWEVLAFVLSRPISLFASNWTVLLAFFLIVTLLMLILLGLSSNPECGERIVYLLDGAALPGKVCRVICLVIFVLILPVYTLLAILLETPLVDIQDPFFTTLARTWQLVTYTFTGLPNLGIRPVSFPNLALRLWLFWVLGLLAAFLLHRGRRGVALGKALALSLLLQATIYVGCAWATAITPFPFSLDGWSESSRYYYASLPFSQGLYGVDVPLSIWHPTRYFLQSIPFFIPGLPLVLHRLWQVALWIGITSLSVIFLTRHLRISDCWLRWIFAVWAFLFILQTSVYYHLQVCVILILVGFSLAHPKRTLIVVVLASFWAGMSRLNWFPVPAMLACLLYFLERPWRKDDKFWAYFSSPIQWGAVGTATAFFSQFLYIRWSGNSDMRAFGSSLTSDLLWYRLLPNPTFSPGIVLAALLVALPVILLIAGALRSSRRLGGWSLAGVIAIFAMLFIGGLVVSVKIGGGGDLHNLDAFLVTVMICGGLLLQDGLVVDARDAPAGRRTGILFTWVVAITLLFAIVPYTEFKTYDRVLVDYQLDEIRKQAEHAAASGDVLFISQRHLVTFDLVDVPLAPEYELLTLMEMALSGNSPYLEAFHADLRTGRFSLIVAPEQKTIYKGAAYSFGEENDAWTENITPLLLCYYEPVQTYPDLGVQLLVPKLTSTACNP